MAGTRGRDNRAVQRAVCFDRRDYAGPVRRVVIVCIDFVAAVVLSFGVLVGVWWVWLIRYPQSDPPPEALWVVPAVVYLYLTVLKRSRIRTMGYLLTGVRIVNIEGKRPSLLQMTVRMLPLPLVPLTLLFDLAWVVDEPQRQTLRDKWAGTYVVRRGTQPIGTAPVRYKRIGCCGLFFIFPEIDRTETTAQSSL